MITWNKGEEVNVSVSGLAIRKLNAFVVSNKCLYISKSLAMKMLKAGTDMPAPEIEKQLEDFQLITA